MNIEIPSELDADGKLRWIFDHAVVDSGWDADSIEHVLLGFVSLEAERDPLVVERFQAFIDAELEAEEEL